MAASWNLEWLNLNANRAYPLREDASRTSADGSVVVPNYLLVDVSLSVSGLLDGFYLSRVAHSAGALSLTISDTYGPAVGTTINLEAHSTNTPYPVSGLSGREDAAGHVVLGDLSALKSDFPEGVYLFTPEAAALETRAVRPDIRGVSSLRASYMGEESPDLRGVVRLLAGDNIRLTYIPPDDTLSLPAGIQIDALDTTDFETECDCGTPTGNLPPPIRSINGVFGDGNHNVELVPSECLRIESGANLLRLIDTCAKPCCGCSELDFLRMKAGVLDDATNKLAPMMARLESALAELRLAVVSVGGISVSGAAGGAMRWLCDPDTSTCSEVDGKLCVSGACYDSAPECQAYCGLEVDKWYCAQSDCIKTTSAVCGQTGVVCYSENTCGGGCAAAQQWWMRVSDMACMRVDAAVCAGRSDCYASQADCLSDGNAFGFSCALGCMAALRADCAEGDFHVLFEDCAAACLAGKCADCVSDNAACYGAGSVSDPSNYVSDTCAAATSMAVQFTCPDTLDGNACSGYRVDCECSDSMGLPVYSCRKTCCYVLAAEELFLNSVQGAVLSQGGGETI